MREPLLFSGIRYPSARVVERREVPGRQRSGFGVQWRETLVVEAVGKGRAYQIKHAEGWWRDLAEVRFDDERLVLRFMKMRGHPLGELSPGTQIVTHRWESLTTVLRQAASAWEPVAVGERVGDVRGPIPLEEMLGRYVRNPELARMKISAFHPDRAKLAAGFMRAFDPEWNEKQLYVAYQGLQPVTVARSLAAYCMAAAASSLRAGLPMRRCEYCNAWFDVHYANARWCSAACRAAQFNKRVSPHAFRADEVGP